jgi:hypothetical protein
MNSEEIKALALDTLYGRRMHQSGTCFTHNEAGMELTRCSTDALPIIEHVIDCTVIPTLRDPQMRHDWDAKIANAPEHFQKLVTYNAGLYGFDYLLGAYLLIGVRNNEPRTFYFLRQSDPEVLQKAIGAIGTFFRWMGNEYNFGVSPSQPLRDFVNEQRCASSPRICDVAERVWQKLATISDTASDTA